MPLTEYGDSSVPLKLAVHLLIGALKLSAIVPTRAMANENGNAIKNSTFKKRSDLNRYVSDTASALSMM